MRVANDSGRGSQPDVVQMDRWGEVVKSILRRVSTSFIKEERDSPNAKERKGGQNLANYLETPGTWG